MLTYLCPLDLRNFVNVAAPSFLSFHSLSFLYLIKISSVFASSSSPYPSKISCYQSSGASRMPCGIDCDPELESCYIL